tara:strand:+ start:9242 stop:9469 length:228 start_codon:yes stop_codon:yes gene_type:complete
MDKVIHRVGLLTNKRDSEVKKIVESIYDFMISEISKKDFDNDEDTNFFHQHLGKFYFKKRVYLKLKEQTKNKKND